MRLDIACGQNKTPGFKGIDLSGDADIKHDLFQYPWPVKSNSVTDIVTNHFVEHIPHYRPEWGAKDGWWMFWDEVYRITKKDAKINIVHPYVKSDRAFWDPTHVRFIHETTWFYLDKNWRTAQGLDHYDTIADFEIITLAGNGVPDNIATRSIDFQTFARNHYWNAIADLSVELKRR